MDGVVFLRINISQSLILGIYSSTDGVVTEAPPDVIHRAFQGFHIPLVVTAILNIINLLLTFLFTGKINGGKISLYKASGLLSFFRYGENLLKV